MGHLKIKSKQITTEVALNLKQNMIKQMTKYYRTGNKQKKQGMNRIKIKRVQA